jgi:hypothetical protein
MHCFPYANAYPNFLKLNLDGIAFSSTLSFLP